MGNPAAQVPVPTATAASGAMDILGKVHGAYTNLTSLSVSGTSVMVIDLSQIKPADIQAAESAGGRTNKAPRKIPKLPKSQTVTTDVSIKLARPDLYRVVENINTAMGRFTNKFTIAAWSAEKGDYTLFGKNYSKAGDRDSAFRAIGSSGGLATAIAQLFYGEESQMGKFITDWGQTDDDSLDGEDCYTLTAKMFGQKLKMWVDKSSYMILQSQVTLGGAISDADLNAAMDTFDTKTNLTQAQIDRMKAQTKQQAMMMTKIKGTVTETYDDIETNQTYSADEFDYTLPANAKLTPSQF